MSRVRVYIATSLDGFIAGSDDDLSWLPEGDPSAVEDSGGVGFHEFLAEVGALLMGRRTYDVLAGFGEEWHYGDRPVLVATHRELEPIHELVRPVTGDVASLIAQAEEAAAGKDIYLDGGNIIRQALDTGRVDELIMTIVPTVLGGGIPLFTGTAHRHAFELVSHESYGAGLVQLRLRPRQATQLSI